jgi:hypothetical protein
MSECSRTYRQTTNCVLTEEESEQPRNVRLVAYAVINVTTNAVIKAPQSDGRCTVTSPVFVAFGAFVLVAVKGGAQVARGTDFW